jgi:hypothetical protein
VTKCIVYACPRAAESGELCHVCRSYLAHGIGGHETLMRPAWELLPRLDAIQRGLTISTSELLHNAAINSLTRLAESLRTRRRVPNAREAV